MPQILYRIWCRRGTDCRDMDGCWIQSL